MKATIFSNPVSGFRSMLLYGFVFCMVLPWQSLQAQMTFTQTLNADFSKGTLNNVVVTDDNIIPQFIATGAGSWQSATSLPLALSGHRLASGNGKYVYLVGGAGISGLSAAVYVATIQTSGISAWTLLNPLPAPLMDPVVVVGTNTLYVIGGRNTTQTLNAIYHAPINADGSLGTWQTSALTLPVGLWGHSGVYLNGIIYLAGGSTVLADTSASTNVFWLKIKADNSIASVNSTTGLPSTRNMAAMVTYNGKLYLFGGYNDSGVKTATTLYTTPDPNGSTGSWSEGGGLPVALSNHTAIAANGLVMILGGATVSSYSNVVYYANPDQAQPWTWTASANLMYEPVKDGCAFQGNGIIFYGGGVNLAGVPSTGCRFSTLSLSTNYAAHGSFISYPFYELGAERLINMLTFTTYFNPTWANCQVSYRTALSDKLWSDWTTVTATSPINVNLTRQYLQYKVEFSSQGLYKPVFCDMSMKTPGTPVSGNLNSTLVFTKAASPFWVTGDITFSTGTHTFDAGATVLFAPETGMTVTQASIICNGTAADSVQFKNQGVETGKWEGLYFDPTSDNAVSSQLYYTVISGGGYGTNNANLYCNQTTEPLLSRCSIRHADGDGIRMVSSNLNIQYTSIRNNSENGVNLDVSSPNFVSCSLSFNGLAGVFLNSTTATYTASTIDHNTYGFRFNSPNFTISMPTGSPILTDNTYNGFAFNGGDITTSNKYWYYLPYDYFILGNIRIVKSAANVRLTISPGITIRNEPGIQIQVGAASNGGELYAVGTADSLITFTARNGLSGGWSGIYFQDANDNYSGTSMLKYCRIEKGAANNLLCETSSQPLLDHCTLSQATGNGVKLATASITIRNSTFSANGSAGLYLDGTTNTPVGNNTAYSCSFYSNGTYALYNNTTNNINAMYNYWGTDDSATVTARIYDKYDLSSKGYVYFSPFTSIPFLPTNTMTMSGYVKYDNTAVEPMKNVSMALKNFGDTIIGSASTGTTGTYGFSPVNSGCYKMTITPSDPWGGGNSTDALLILNHFTQTSLLTGMKLKSADVNASKTVNATDALFIMRRYAGMISSFPSGDFYTRCDTLAISANQVTDNYRMICYGDVNGSFAPAGKQSSSGVSLEYEGSLVIPSFSEFDLPVKMTTGMDAGAISLGFYYPAEYLEITGAELSNGCNSFSWTATNGLFRMAWCDQNPISIPEEGLFLIMHMRSKELDYIASPLNLTLYEISEFADIQAIVAQGVVISVPEILPLTTGFAVPAVIDEMIVKVFQQQGIITLGVWLPGDRALDVSCYDLMGHKVAGKKIDPCPKGHSLVRFETPGLAPGIYLMKILSNQDGQVSSKIIKVLVSR